MRSEGEGQAAVCGSRTVQSVRQGTYIKVVEAPACRTAIENSKQSCPAGSIVFEEKARTGAASAAAQTPVARNTQGACLLVDEAKDLGRFVLHGGDERGAIGGADLRRLLLHSLRDTAGMVQSIPSAAVGAEGARWRAAPAGLG